MKREEILQDAIDFWNSRAGRPREGRGQHMLTGPIYIEGAEPGDTLEVQIVDYTLRTPFGTQQLRAGKRRARRVVSRHQTGRQATGGRAAVDSHGSRKRPFASPSSRTTW